jgi:hypothetical protein
VVVGVAVWRWSEVVEVAALSRALGGAYDPSLRFL